MSLGGGMDSITGSLEDLVSTFDEKLTMCFADYQEQVDKIAPVQVNMGRDAFYNYSSGHQWIHFDQYMISG